ncbi:MAG: SDR family NAD(P)-dependent oxidoreductase, partial [Candidatus Promineifilaceae bacterium]
MAINHANGTMVAAWFGNHPFVMVNGNKELAMDFGLTGKKALVCASSQGLGFACAVALAEEGVHVWINGRGVEKLMDSAEKIRTTTGNPNIFTAVGDLTTEAGRAAIVAACPDADILVNNNAGPRPGTFQDWDRDRWMGAIEGNMLAPIFMIHALLPGMRERKFGRIVNITSAMVKAPRPHQGLSTAARSGLTALSKAISKETVRDNVTINNILPERIYSPRTEFLIKREMDVYS